MENNGEPVVRLQGNSPAGSAAPGFDAGDYLPELAEFDISEAEKVEMLQTLWSILSIFVDLRLDVHNLSAVFDASGSANGDAVALPSNPDQ